ncbi:hypothetical protein KMZ15_02385 [Mycoavidus sp. HKI]|uniref:hypothetical protein n=1 Tax=Mycoavidus sp. HKI TaxID=2840467 RepID=UPI001CBF3E84|nr:hypothetical protein [Mycoavidus sp. HKI]UAW64549.1 hypothetical protein KMZ15_02385 [Mycoavidus sp. HKI]
MSTNLVKHSRNCELIISSFDDFNSTSIIKDRELVCLLIVNNFFDKEKISHLVKKIIDLGAVFFLTCGKFSDEVHDLIDKIIEVDNNRDLSYIATTSHKNEEIKDISYFFIRSTYLDPKEYRCLALFDRYDSESMELQSELMKVLDEGYQ